MIFARPSSVKKAVTCLWLALGIANASQRATSAAQSNAYESLQPPAGGRLKQFAPLESRPVLVSAPDSTANSGVTDTNLKAVDADVPLTASTYVPLDSWIYLALDRLAAMGFVTSQTSGLRPWTRAECLRQILEAADKVKVVLELYGTDVAEAATAQSLIAALRMELIDVGRRKNFFVIESMYARQGFIVGAPLTDGYHFGQTWANDFGRQFNKGWNSQYGFAARVEAGRWFGYFQGEHQYAPAQGPLSIAIRELIARLDGNPIGPAKATPPVNRFRSIEAYAGLRISNLQLSIGKQSLYWGPTYDAPLSFSTNAEPTTNLRLVTVHPFTLPGMLRFLGQTQVAFVIGKLGGHSYTWRPWFNAQKVTFKLTDNLEMGFTRWSIFWGVGHPITIRSFLRNFISFSSPEGRPSLDPDDPGDRKAGFDFRYRVPGLRNWLTAYSDSYADDDPSPLAAPRRAAFNPGIFVPRIPGTTRIDLRVEAPSTMPLKGDQGGNFIYYNTQYHSGNTNYGFLLGNPVGRDGRAVQGWLRCWFSPRSHLELGYRQRKIGNKMLEGGGTQSNVMLKLQFELASRVWLEHFMQFERYWIPSLGGPTKNVSMRWQMRWEPRIQLLRKATTEVGSVSTRSGVSKKVLK